MEMLTKQGDRYGLTLDSATFLDKRSPAYLGSATEFLCSPQMFENTKTIADAVRKGGTVMEDEGTVSTENPLWVKFARGMAPLMAMPAQLMAKLVQPQPDREVEDSRHRRRPWSIRDRICREQPGS